MLQGYEDIELFVQQVLVVFVLTVLLLQSLEHPPSAIALCLAKNVETFARYGSKVGKAFRAMRLLWRDDARCRVHLSTCHKTIHAALQGGCRRDIRDKINVFLSHCQT